jgi:hypothetical protein
MGVLFFRSRYLGSALCCRGTGHGRTFPSGLVWATLNPLDATSLCIEITAHGEFGLISRKDKGVTHWPAIRAVRVDRVVWDSMVKCPSIKDTPRGAPDATEGRAPADDSDRD